MSKEVAKRIIARAGLIPLEPRSFNMVQVYHPSNSTYSIVTVIGLDRDMMPIAVAYSHDSTAYFVYRLRWIDDEYQAEYLHNESI